MAQDARIILRHYSLHYKLNWNAVVKRKDISILHFI